MKTLKQTAAAHEKDTASYQEIVPYIGFITPRLILNKDGSLMAMYRMTGLDLDSCEQDLIDAAAANMETAFRQLDGRITLWYHVVHRESREFPAGDFAQPMSAMLNETHRARMTAGDQYSNTIYVSITFTPASGVSGFFDRVGVHSTIGGKNAVAALVESAKDAIFKRACFAFDQAEIDRGLAQFNAVLDAFVGTSTLVKFQPLELMEYAQTLHDLINPASAGQPVHISLQYLLDGYLPDNTIRAGHDALLFEHVMGNRYVQGVSVKDWPEKTGAGMLREILSVKGNYVISHCFRVLDQDTSKDLITKAKYHYMFTSKGMFQRLVDAASHSDSERDRGVASLMDQAEEALAELTTSNIQYGLHNLTIFAIERDLSATAETLRKVTSILNAKGAIAVKESLNLFAAWAGNIPGQWGEQPRLLMVKSAALSNLAPLQSLNGGERVSKHLSEKSGTTQPAMTVFSTRHNIPYWFNPHYGDVGHTVIIGPTGAGKTVFENFCIAQYQKYRPITVIFDKDRGCKIPTLLQGGEHVDILRDHVHMAPLAMIGDKSSRPWAARFVEMLAGARGEKINDEDAKAIWEGVIRLASMPRNLWTISHLASAMGSARLSALLRPWCEGGEFGGFFDQAEDGFSVADFSCIEIGDLMGRFPLVVAPFLEYAFFMLNRKIDGVRPVFIDVQEIWFPLRNEIFRRRFEDWLKTLRKKNAMVWGSTQSLAEIDDSDIAASLIDNMPNKIFLANPQAQAHKQIYMNRFALTESEVSMIQTMVPKREYFLKRPDISRVITLPLDRKSLAMLSSEDTAQAVFEQYRQQGGDDWQSRYIEHMTTRS